MTEAASSPGVEQKLIRRVAMALYRAEHATPDSSSPADKRAGWNTEKAEYGKRARKFYRSLQRDGIKMSLEDEAR
jgi:hypothetical protein